MTGAPLPPLARARWPQVADAERTVLVLPVGSMEQHGPHLPLSTDAVLAEAVAARLHAARPQAGLAPVLAFGASGEHREFPGTLSIGTSALQEVVVELVRHASLSWGGVLVVSGHGGNAEALRAAAALCRAEGRMLAVTEVGRPGMDAHAGRAETSMMLAVAPDLVRGDLAEPGVRTPVTELMPVLAAQGVRAVSPNGVLGDPAGASAQEGVRLLDAIVAAAVARYDACERAVRATRPGAAD